MGPVIGLYNINNFVNNAGGAITIDRSTSAGLYNSTGGTFTNAAAITIGATATVGQVGLQNQASFVNNVGGAITIDRSSTFGLSNNAGGTFTNAATITIGATATVGSAGIQNENTFSNNACTGLINIVSNSIIDNTGTFTNGGTVIENASGNSSVSSNSGLVQNLNGGTFTITNNTGALTTASGLVWTGCTSTDWATATNWSLGMVPTATDNVVIPTGTTNQPIIGAGTLAVAYSMEVQSGASLSIVSTGRLTVDGAKGTEASATSFSNSGTVQNSGQLVIGNVPVGEVGLLNVASFFNNAGGTITIDRTFTNSLYNQSGTFTNAGTITIGGAATAGQDALYNVASFVNSAGGVITIDRSTNSGLNNAAGTFTNAGTITIGGVVTAGQAGLLNQANFVNNAGAIIIDRSALYGLYNQEGSFTNAATITVGGTLDGGSTGLYNLAAFANNVGGAITIDRTNNNGLYNNGTSTFVNSATITIGASASVGQNGLRNEFQASFINNGCAVVNLFARVNNTATFTNTGLLRVNTAQAHINQALTNNGIVEYVQGNPIPNVTNNTFTAASLSVCASVTPALQLGGSNNFTAGSTWYKDQALTVAGGTYDQATNTFTVTNLAAGSTYPLFFTVSDGGNICPRLLTINVTVSTPPVATIGGTLTVVAGGTTTLTASGGNSFTWSTGQTTASITATAGPYSVTVANAGGCTSTASATVTTNNGANQPPVATTNTNQTATVGTAFSYTVNAFTDAETPGSLTYAASITPSNGLIFNQSARVISGTPSVSGVSGVTVTATDPGGLSASTSFTITVNPAPVVITSLTLVASANPTTILTTGTTTLSATVSGGTAPYIVTFAGPGTINSSGNTANVSGLSAGVQTFTVIARDATTPTSQTISTTVSVTVTAANQPPVATANANQTVMVGTPFIYTVNAFSDETPNSLTYTATIVPANGLSFDPAARVISGTPSLSGVSTVTVTATDPGGLSASTVFTITVSGSATQPTGPATLTITSVNCSSTNGALSRVDFVVGYSNNTFTPALPPLFINGVTASGQLGVPYTFDFDNNARFLPIADNASRQVYFVWDFRAACAGSATPPAQPTPPVAPTLPNQTATQGTPFTYTVPAFGGTTPINYAVTGLPAGLSFDASSRTISGTPSLTGVSTVVISASNTAGQSSGQFTITVSGSATQPTGPATLTITSFNCSSTNGALSRVDFVVGYSDGTFTPAVPNLFINGVTITGQLGQTYSFPLDANTGPLPIQDNASRSTYFVWDFRAACAGPVAPTAPVATSLPNQTATQGAPFSYVVPAFSGTGPITYSATGLPAGLIFNAATRAISGTPSLTGVSTVVIAASNVAGQSNGQFTITVSGSAVQPPAGQPLSLLAPSYDCGTGSFTFRSTGGDGSAIEYFAVGITNYTTIAGPYTVLPAGDAQPFTLKARQSGVEVTYTWDFKAVCSGSSRVGVAESPSPWMIKVLGNPVTDEIHLEVQGGMGQELALTLTDLSGRVVLSRVVRPEVAVHQEVLPVDTLNKGLLLLRVSSASQRQTVKVLHQ